MTVYIDNAFIPAKVPNGRVVHDSKWCHLFADTPEELHDFAAKLGLKRSYFQSGKPRGDSSPSPHWHYDVTAGMRAKAVKLGACEVEWRDAPRIMRERDQRAAGAQGERVMVTGSRGITDEQIVSSCLHPHFTPGAVLVSGHCPDGVDGIAERLWTEWGGTVEEHPPDWRAHGKAAGFIRNTEMAESRPGKCVSICLDNSGGTEHATGEAGKRQIPVDRHDFTTCSDGIVRPAEIARTDHAAGMAFKEGRYVEAARMLNEARKQFPGQAELWARRSDPVMARMRAANQTDPNDRRPLAEIVQERLTQAGVKPSDREITNLRNWNLDQLTRDPDISNTPEPADDREAAS